MWPLLAFPARPLGAGFLGCAAEPPPPPPPLVKPAPIPVLNGVIGVVRRAPDTGAPQILFPQIDLHDPATDGAPLPVRPPPAALSLRWVGDPPPGSTPSFEVTNLAWAVRCVDDGGTHFALTAPLAAELVPAQEPGDERGGIVGFVAVTRERPGVLAPPILGLTRRLEAPGVAAVDENVEATRTCTSDTDAATYLVTPSGRSPIGCCGP